MKNLKVIASAALLPLLATTALANDCHKKAHGGFSIGAHVGYGSSDSKFDRTLLPGQANSRAISGDLGGRGAVGGLALAYGHVFANNLFAGLEIKGDLSGVKGDTTDLPPSPGFALKTEMKQKESYGANIKLGGVIHSVLPYVQFGIVSTKFEKRNTLITNGGNRAFNFNKRHTGFEFGVGVDIPVAERFTVGAKFLHTEYNKHNYVWNVVGTDVITSSVKPKTNAFLLTAKYRVW